MSQNTTPHIRSDVVMWCATSLPDHVQITTFRNKEKT